MDFLDSLKSIKKEMQIDAAKKTSKNEAKQQFIHNDLKTQEELIDKQMQEIFLKQEKLQDEFSEFIKNTDIKKI